MTQFSFANMNGQNVRRGRRQLKGETRWSAVAGNVVLGKEAPKSRHPHQKRAGLVDAAPAGVAAEPRRILLELSLSRLPMLAYRKCSEDAVDKVAAAGRRKMSAIVKRIHANKDTKQHILSIIIPTR